MKEITQEKDLFKTPDLCLCASLQCYGYQIWAIDRTNPSKVVFSIERDEQLDDLMQQYFTHQLSVDPLYFFGHLKELKTRIYQS